MNSLKCTECGGPLPEKALLVLSSLRVAAPGKPINSCSIVVMESEGFEYITRANNGVCGIWCASERFRRKVLDTMEGPRAAEAFKEKVPA